MSQKSSQKIEGSVKISPLGKSLILVLFFECNVFFIVGFILWFKLILLISDCLCQITHLIPRIRLSLLSMLKDPTSYQESPSPPPPPDYRLLSRATVRRGAGRPGIMERSPEHNDDDRDREIATTSRRRRRRRRERHRCTQENGMIAFYAGSGFFSF